MVWSVQPRVTIGKDLVFGFHLLFKLVQCICSDSCFLSNELKHTHRQQLSQACFSQGISLESYDLFPPSLLPTSLSLSHTHTECMPFPCNLSHYRFPFIPSCAVFSTYSCFFFPKLLFFFIILISYSQLCRICLFLWGSGTKCGSASNNLFAPSSPSSLEAFCQAAKWEKGLNYLVNWRWKKARKSLPCL